MAQLSLEEQRRINQNTMVCPECGRTLRENYCRDCDEDYWSNHTEDCQDMTAKEARRHEGHRHY